MSNNNFGANYNITYLYIIFGSTYYVTWTKKRIWRAHVRGFGEHVAGDFREKSMGFSPATAVVVEFSFCEPSKHSRGAAPLRAHRTQYN